MADVNNSRRDFLSVIGLGGAATVLGVPAAKASPEEAAPFPVELKSLGGDTVSNEIKIHLDGVTDEMVDRWFAELVRFHDAGGGIEGHRGVSLPFETLPYEATPRLSAHKWEDLPPPDVYDMLRLMPHSLARVVPKLTERFCRVPGCFDVVTDDAEWSRLVRDLARRIDAYNNEPEPRYTYQPHRLVSRVVSPTLVIDIDKAIVYPNAFCHALIGSLIGLGEEVTRLYDEAKDRLAQTEATLGLTFDKTRSCFRTPVSCYVEREAWVAKIYLSVQAVGYIFTKPARLT